MNTMIPDNEITQFAERHHLSGAIRNLRERGLDVVISRENLPGIVASIRKPETPIESMDLLLEVIMRKGKKPGDQVDLKPETDYPLVFAHDADEFQWLVDKARELRLLEPSQFKGAGLSIHVGGWERLADVGKLESRPDQAFVAMWFDESMGECWREGIEPALKATGYQPLRVDMEQYNDKVDDRIIAEIRRSRIVVADFTGNRGGVYFEAGFAKGLGLEVIFMVKKDHVAQLHFDTRQFNHIVWTTCDDLREQLTHRILATVPLD